MLDSFKYNKTNAAYILCLLIYIFPLFTSAYSCKSLSEVVGSMIDVIPYVAAFSAPIIFFFAYRHNDKRMPTHGNDHQSHPKSYSYIFSLILTFFIAVASIGLGSAIRDFIITKGGAADVDLTQYDISFYSGFLFLSLIITVPISVLVAKIAVPEKIAPAKIYKKSFIEAVISIPVLLSVIILVFSILLKTVLAAQSIVNPSDSLTNYPMISDDGPCSVSVLGSNAWINGIQSFLFGFIVAALFALLHRYLLNRKDNE